MRNRFLRSLSFHTAPLAAALLLVGCGGGGSSSKPSIDPVQSSFVAGVTFGTPADGLARVGLTVTVLDTAGNPIEGAAVRLQATGFGNDLAQPPATDANGLSIGSLASTVGEAKTLTAFADNGGGEVAIGSLSTEFLRILPGTYFVRSSGSDGNSGTTPVEAWQSLSFAATQLVAGDVLYVGAGAYFGPIDFTVDSSATDALQIIADREGTFTGDAGDVLVDAAGSDFALRFDGAANFVLRGFSLRNATPAGRGGALWLRNADAGRIYDIDAYESQRGIDIEGSTDVRLESSRLTNNFGDGLVLAGSSDITLANNLIYNNAAAGVHLRTPSTDLDLLLNTIYRNEADQVFEASAGNTGMLANNILTEGRESAIELATGSVLSTTNNLSWAHGVASLPPPIGGTLVGDPFFVDPFGNDGVLGGVGARDDDFRLAAGSAAIDAGDRFARDIILDLGTLSSLTTRIDGLPDGTGSDGPLVNLGYHYEVDLDDFASLSADGGRAAFAASGESMVQTRAWNRETRAWDLAVRTQTANTEIKWLTHRTSPIDRPDEMFAALADTGSGAHLIVRNWDGRHWNDDFPAPFSTSIASANTDERGFDLQYELNSGEGLLVYSVDDADPQFRTYTDGQWSEEASVFSTAPGTGTILWIELIPRPGTDEIALVGLDDMERLVGALWDGDQWIAPALLATQIVETRGYQAFDAAWESVSGDLLIAWGFNVFAEETRFATLDGQTRIWVTGQFTSTDAIGAQVVLSPDPTSDRIAGIFGEGFDDDDVTVSVWDGDTWTHTVEFALHGEPRSRSLDVGWFGTTGRAYAIFRRQDLTEDFNFAIFDDGWRGYDEIGLPGMAPLVRTELRTPAGENGLVGLMLDENGALFGVEYDGTDWSVRNGGNALATGLDPANAGRAFSFDLRQP